jgi:hypothetical protein
MTMAMTRPSEKTREYGEKEKGRRKIESALEHMYESIYNVRPTQRPSNAVNDTHY